MIDVHKISKIVLVFLYASAIGCVSTPVPLSQEETLYYTTCEKSLEKTREDMLAKGFRIETNDLDFFVTKRMQLRGLGGDGHQFYVKRYKKKFVRFIPRNFWLAVTKERPLDIDYNVGSEGTYEILKSSVCD